MKHTRVDLEPKDKASELVYLFCANPKLDWEEAKEIAKICVNEILKSNPSVINCDNVEFDYQYWILVGKEIDKL